MKQTKKQMSIDVIGALLMSGVVQAQTTINWNGEGEGNAWSTPGNWAGGNVPDSNAENYQ